MAASANAVKHLLRAGEAGRRGMLYRPPPQYAGQFRSRQDEILAAIAAHARARSYVKRDPRVDPRTALVIVMESGIYASKLTPAVLKTA